MADPAVVPDVPKAYMLLYDYRATDADGFHHVVTEIEEHFGKLSDLTQIIEAKVRKGILHHECGIKTFTDFRVIAKEHIIIPIIDEAGLVEFDKREQARRQALAVERQRAANRELYERLKAQFEPGTADGKSS